MNMTYEIRGKIAKANRLIEHLSAQFEIERKDDFRTFIAEVVKLDLPVLALAHDILVEELSPEAVAVNLKGIDEGEIAGFMARTGKLVCEIAAKYRTEELRPKFDKLLKRLGSKIVENGVGFLLLRHDGQGKVQCQFGYSPQEVEE